MILLNHQHLFYFWMVAKEGSITKASQKLYLGQPTVSAQIRQLEKALGKTLFLREKRRLVLTEEGRIALDHANDIFSSTQELLDRLHDQPSNAGLSIHLGVDANVSKQMMLLVLKAIYRYRPNAHVIVEEGPLSELIDGLRAHTLDIVLSDQARTGRGEVDYFKVEAAHLEILWVAIPRLARRVKAPRDLSGVPLALPARGSPIWSGVEQFLLRHKVEARVIAEVGDTELLRLLALEGLGAAPLPDVAIAADLRAKRLVRVGPGSLGVSKKIWLIAKKRQRPNAIAQHLLDTFRFQIKR